MSLDPTVFVVDDDEDARDSVCALVRSMSVRAESFSSGEAFLTAYDQTRSGCLVTDFRMLGMSGIDLLVRLKQAGMKLPVIIISGYVNVSSAVRAMKKGATNVLTKPYEQQDLWDTISKAEVQQLRPSAARTGAAAGAGSGGGSIAGGRVDRSSILRALLRAA